MSSPSLQPALLILGVAALLGPVARAQVLVPTSDNGATGWQHYDWLKPDATLGAAHAATNPPAVSSIGPEDPACGQKNALPFPPLEKLTLRGNVHDSMTDNRRPFNAVLTLGVDSDRTTTDAPSGGITQTPAYDAKQSPGKLPLTGDARPDSSLPSLEPSLVWKPLEDTTVQAGLRPQQYEEYPGIKDPFNEAIFADWSQRVAGDVTWHSYAEVLNSRSLVDQAPAAPIASGAHGTPQATTPGSNPSLSSALPVSLDDQTFTFSTGPSFRLEKDISASVEYSNRWDQNPAPGNVGPEQRVSVSVKGTF